MMKALWLALGYWLSNYLNTRLRTLTLPKKLAHFAVVVSRRLFRMFALGIIGVILFTTGVVVAVLEIARTWQPLTEWNLTVVAATLLGLVGVTSFYFATTERRRTWLPKHWRERADEQLWQSEGQQQTEAMEQIISQMAAHLITWLESQRPPTAPEPPQSPKSTPPPPPAEDFTKPSTNHPNYV